MKWSYNQCLTDTTWSIIDMKMVVVYHYMYHFTKKKIIFLDNLTIKITKIICSSTTDHITDFTRAGLSRSQSGFGSGSFGFRVFSFINFSFIRTL